MKGIFRVLTKILFAVFFLLSSLYCVLAYVPFTAQQVVKGDLIPALNVFARNQHYLYWLVLLLAAGAIGVNRSRINVRFWIFHLAAGVYLLLRPVLAKPDSSIRTLLWAFAMLSPLVWLAVLDLSASFPLVRWKTDRPDQERALFHAAWRSAFFLTLVYGSISVARHQASDWGRTAGWFGFGASLLSHLLVFILFFVVLNFLSVVASWFSTPPRVQFFLFHLLGAGMLFMVFQNLAFPALGFNGLEATLYSASFSLSLTAFLAGISLAAVVGTEIESGLSVAFWMGPGRRRSSAVLLALGAVGLAGVATVLALTVSRMDWNFLFQKLSVLLIWIGTFRLFFSGANGRQNFPSRTGRLLTCALVMLPLYRTWEATRNAAWKATGEKQTREHFLDQWSGFDVSFKLIRDMMTMDARDDGFYGFLTASTNIPHSKQIAPVPVNVVNDLKYTEGKKPNIFIIVVDSLRRDYLSPYNDQVNFTPSVAQFAKENIVMENAFTHYGATGLSEPSIWVGGMNLHKQYVTPFAPMNALQKLLEAEKYKAFVSRDTILQTVLPEWPGLAEIDQGHATMDYDLCVSLDEMGTRVTQEPKDTRMFGYTQAQNIHVSTINRQGGKPISSDNFGSFYAPYASRLKRIDGCFGTFIDKLKSTGLYESSIVILTADHGDSLGEQGRWGHAYSIYPEIMRIPMIIHVPPEIRQSLFINPKALAFSTDITPSLYYLTGHKPLNRGEMFGRPLFTEMQGDQKEWHHDNYLVVSSYGPVYGILDGDGRELTVFDAVNYKDYSFDLSSFLGGQEALTSSTRAAMTKLVRQKVLALDTFYGFTPPEPAAK
jgi:hypothetical protein